ncbi:hypothetical protein BDY17DRAFT_98364 [Neohortaea acidophila]|uniref:Uncharacterized protein n=1 Tax=Neohortaea acidophila TaxID=245834 RepID=A0A6A6PZL5_9PEZI|nr:uncharacterized protein BDY17DRAFT_98364 [Neohortaea acidophila]KAF2485194.1 hypothetical protein BDY17DRAFT_98364 [Neohortaea acidophila]
MSHGFLSRPQQGLQSLSGRLPNSLAPDGGSVQHVPDDVLQELQQQRAGEEEARDRGAGPPSEPHRRDGRHGETGETSLPLPSPDLPPSPSPSPLGPHASRHPRYSRPPIPRRRSGRYSDARGVAQAPLPLPLRSAARPRSATSPRSPAPVSSQFVGGRVETDAHLLEPNRETDGATTAESMSESLSIPKNAAQDYFSAFNSDTPTSPGLSHYAPFPRTPGSINRPSFPRTPGSIGRISFSRFTPSTNHSSPRSTDSAGRLSISRSPGSTGRPSFSRSPASIGCFPFPRSFGPPPRTPSPSPSLSSSSDSNASSFAYFVRDRRGDRTLLKKKNRPLQHRTKAPPVGQAPLPLHSPSYYIPKIVEESATIKVLPQTPPPLSARLPGPRPKAPDATTRGRTQLRQSESISSLRLRSSSSKARPGGPDTDSHPRTPGSQAVPTVSSPDLKTAGRDSSLPPTVMRLRLPSRHRTVRDFEHVSSEELRAAPEKEPISPMDRPLSHGHHHFQTFGPDMIPTKPHDERQKPQQTEHPPGQTQMPEIPGYFPPASNAIEDRTTRLKMVHKRSSLFNVFRSPHIDSIQEESDGEGGKLTLNKRSVLSMTPTASAVTQYLPTRGPKRRSSTSSRSNATPLDHLGPPTFKWPLTSTPLSTHWEFLVGESKQPSGHVREQTPLSPLTAPQDSIRPKLTREVNFMDVDKVARPGNSKVVNFAPVEQDMIGPPSRSLQAKRRLSTIQISVPSAPSFLPTEMKRVNTPPQAPELSSANAGGFKGFFFDMRSIPPEPGVATSDETTHHPQAHRLRKLLQVKSVQHLLPRLSVPSLKRKQSNDKETAQQHPKTNDPLTVTNFSQTPFSQRLGDTRRNKLNRVRQYIRDTSSTGGRGEYSSTDDEALMLGTFELDVPDHLPNSPLCPLSPKHRGGGVAICPLHGRRRTVGPVVAGGGVVGMGERLGSGVGNGKGKMGPRIVFDSGVQQVDGGWKGS